MNDSIAGAIELLFWLVLIGPRMRNTYCTDPWLLSTNSQTPNVLMKQDTEGAGHLRDTDVEFIQSRIFAFASPTASSQCLSQGLAIVSWDNDFWGVTQGEIWRM